MKKVWAMSTADRYFSRMVRDRDGECQACGKTEDQGKIDCSHYWNRQHYATRYDFDNCIALCSSCHTMNRDNWENDRNGEYRAFMKGKLGEEGYEKLKAKHYTRVKKRDAIIAFMEVYRKHKEKNL